jgi:gliding motility-associated-like protein
MAAPTPCAMPYSTLVCTATGFSADQAFSLTGLTPNTTYYINVDGVDVGPGVTAPAECDFDILVSGPAVDPIINTTVTNATCNPTGQITVNSVTGAVAPLSYSLNGSAFQSSPTFSGLTAGNYELVVTSATGCSFSEEVQVPLTGGPQDGTPTVVNANCSVNDGSITLNGVTGGTGPYNYALNGGAPQASNVFSSLNSGLYSVTVTDATGCSFTYENINVPTNGSITSATFNITQPTCSGGTGTVVINPTGGTAPYTYSLNGGAPQASNTFSGLAPGTYIVFVFDNNGCLYANNELVIEPANASVVPQIIISPSTVSICQGSTATFNAYYSNGGSTPVLQWQVNGTNAGSGTPVFSTTTLNNGDVVTCVLTSNDPCATTTTVTSNQATVTVTPLVTPAITITPSATTICQGQSVSFSSVVTGCASDGTYYWSVNGVMVDSTSGGNFSVVLSANSEVVCTFKCNETCAVPANSSAVDIQVTQVMVDAGPNQQIGKGESAQLAGQATGTYSWSPASTLSDPNSLTPIATPDVTTVYTLTTVVNGCVASDEVVIVVTELIVLPNTFTPNGDGINDQWHIGHIERFPACEVTVYDRWGQKIYNSTGYSNENAWDGTYLGKTLPPAAYYYVIELNAATSEEADTFYGWVSIVY